MVETLYQLGPNHVCVILSRRRDSITSAWYYVSQRRDTSFQVTVSHGKKYLRVVLSLDSWTSIYIFTKNAFPQFFGAKKVLLNPQYILLVFQKLTFSKYHVSVILSRLRDSVTERWYFKNFKISKNRRKFCCSKLNLNWNIWKYLHRVARFKTEHHSQIFFLCETVT